MDDLDALLADLQNSKSISQISLFNSVNSADNVTTNNSITPHHDTSSSSIALDLGNATKNMDNKLNYKPQPKKEYPYEHENKNPEKVYHQSKVLPQHASTLSTNLSELDNLLQELSSAQFNVEVDKRSSGNLSNGSASCANSMYDSFQTNIGSSLATNDLDDLMASLSGMNTSEEVNYSTPNKIKKPPKVNTTECQDSGLNRNNAHDYASTSIYSSEKPEADGQLTLMLEDLNKNMSMQGIQTAPRGHCAACAKLIVGQVITALGQLWHPEHFVCAHCKQEIGTRNFFERDNLPYCEEDYHIIFSPKCAYCHGPILNKCVTALDRTWHPEHFTCYTCGRQLGDEGFHEKDGLIFCQSDYFDHFAPKCGACGQAIMENFITALDQQWHPKCFACFECHKPFGSSSFFEHEGVPYCEVHFHAKRGSLCAHCNQPITGRCITAMFRKFHPDHFVCTYCQKTLNKGTFKEENDKPYCHVCFNKLFS